MGRRSDRLLAAASVLVIAGSVVWVIWLFSLSPGERSEALKLGGFIIPLALAVITVLGSLSRALRPMEPQPINVLADSLAQAIQIQWRKAADERALLTPAPIPVRWSISALPITGTVEASIGSPDNQPPFLPLPGYTRITENDLRAGGGRRELHALYAGLGSGRLVITGDPGAGKSGAANLLLLDALSHRDLVEEEERHRVPVPVLVNALGWDPTRDSIQEWLSRRLTETYPLLQHRGGLVEAMNLVTSQDRIALLLDGLDEMEESLRPTALLALADAPFRVVVLARPPEMIEATRSVWLVGAAAISLHHVTSHDAAQYLARALRGPAPTGWNDLLAHLRDHDSSTLATALSTPLTLTLVRDTYRAGDDVGELLDMNHHNLASDIEDSLIARVLPDAYSRRPGRPEPRYSLVQAQQGLSFIARQMNKRHVRDLAWWHIPTWTPSFPRVLITVILFALLFGLTHGLVGTALSEAKFLRVFIPGLVFGAALGAVFGIPFARGYGEPRRFRLADVSAMITRRSAYRGVLIGIGCGLGVGVAIGLLTWVVGSIYSVRYGITFGIAAGLAAGLFAVFALGKPAEGSPLSPYETWRNDRNIGLGIGAIIGATMGTLIGLRATSAFGILAGLFEGTVFMLAFLLAFGVTSTKTWPANLAWLQLILSRRVPAVSLISYLEYARERGVLRSAGGVYQFRHYSLQHQLVERETSLASAILPAEAK
jgi:hypothetical protein